ncbi:WAT1-related protein At4g30420-like [Zingiber officinale]|uniref:WAT1-related protein n=1 Tax=Zingiber officinale TaxID=94328 RepID=A0A8J5FQC6_ZINOF|nr:WAT1-related protein At4g30420-like [Zingiber officinale]KAG6488690.1 hypothetical protein ZIOFF_049939 [Zingiber officinale]
MSEEYKPALAMVAVQFNYAAMALLAKAAFTKGMSPMVFVVYRQAIASLVLAPISFVATRSRGQFGMGVRAFGFVFLVSLVSALSQLLYYQGLEFASSSMATAMNNLTPSITFVMAASLGLEKVELRSMRSMAKVLGTLICVAGAITMAFFKGPRLLAMELCHMMLQSASNNWIIGSLFLIGSSICWSGWLIMQGSICENYLDPLSLSTWMCCISTIQSAIFTFLLQPSLSAWKMTSLIELFSCLFAGIFGSAVTYYLQSWCISVKGPLFSALFNPLCTVITTIVACIFLHEQLHLGSLIGAVTVVSGLYLVLWSKAEDYEIKSRIPQIAAYDKITVAVEAKVEDDLRKPLIEG